jgi:hypothetical protein
VALLPYAIRRHRVDAAAEWLAAGLVNEYDPRSSGQICVGRGDLPLGKTIEDDVRCVAHWKTVSVRDAGGSGSVEIKVPSGVPAGDYYLEAQDSTGAYLAQSVGFHVGIPPAE